MGLISPALLAPVVQKEEKLDLSQDHPAEGIAQREQDPRPSCRIEESVLQKGTIKSELEW